jgi:hypothetical protein
MQHPRRSIPGWDAGKVGPGLGRLGGELRQNLDFFGLFQALERYPAKWNRFAPPEAGFFCAVASLRVFADAKASPCEARLTTAQKNRGQMVPFSWIAL